MDYEINRSICIVKPLTPFLHWIHGLPGEALELTLSQIRVDCTALLVPACDELEQAIAFIDGRVEELFEMELDSWCTDKSLWPQKRTLKLFWEWFEVEVHSVALDISQIED